MVLLIDMNGVPRSELGGMDGRRDGWMDDKGPPLLTLRRVPSRPIPDVAQTVYLTLQAVLGLETLCQWSLEMS